MQIGSVFDISSVDIRDGLISFRVSGEDAYNKFRQESGGHRWQRIPPTESKGRYHTSTITVVVLKGGTISDIIIRNEDLEWKFCRGRGKGGQHRNKRDTAVWLKHKPSGVHVRSEEERSQKMNKAKALSKLQEKLESSQRNLSNSKDTKERRELAGSGQRGDKIRTIRVRDNTVTNHLNGNKMKYSQYVKGDLNGIQE
jgi:peptide chain release factor 1